MRISDWSSDVCSSDLNPQARVGDRLLARRERERRAHRVDAVDLAGGGQAEARCLVLLRDPGGEEVVLQQRDPTTGDGLVERAVVDEDRKSTRLNSSH